MLSSTKRFGKSTGYLGWINRWNFRYLFIRSLSIRFKDSKGKDRPGARTSFKWVPNGIPGVETRLPILFSEGVSKNKISLERFVELTSTNPAKMYGLYPQKGSIKVGSDADITIWDPNKKNKIQQINLSHGSDYTPYEGLDITGWPIQTWLEE